MAAFAVPLEVTNTHGEVLRGELEDRRGEAAPPTCAQQQPPPVAVVCHGFRSSRRSRLVRHLVQQIPISACSFDFSGNGDSDGEFQYGNYAKEVDDLRCVVEHLQDVHRLEVTGVVGHSKAGNVVLLYAAKYGDVARVVNVSGRFDLAKGVEERLGRARLQRLRADGRVELDGYEVTREGLEERLGTDMQRALEAISELRGGGEGCRLRHVHGSEDAVSDCAEARRLHDAAERYGVRSGVRTIAGADHNFSEHLGDLADAVLPFLAGVDER